VRVDHIEVVACTTTPIFSPFWAVFLSKPVLTASFMDFSGFQDLSRNSVVEARMKKLMRWMIERMKAKMMPVNDYGSWIRRIEALEATGGV